VHSILEQHLACSWCNQADTFYAQEVLSSRCSTNPHQAKGMFEVFSRQINAVFGIFILTFVVLAGISLATWNIADPSLSHATDNIVANMLGFWGAVYADLTMQFFGLSGVVALLPPFLWAILLIFQRDMPCFPRCFLFWILSIIFFSAAVSMFPTLANWPMSIGPGGVLGDKLMSSFPHIFPHITEPIIGLLFILLSLIMAFYAGGAICTPDMHIIAHDVDNEDLIQTNRLMTRIRWLMHIFMRLVSFHRSDRRQSDNAVNFFPIKTSGTRVDPYFRDNIATTCAQSQGMSTKSETVPMKSPHFRTTALQQKKFQLPHTHYLSLVKKIPRDDNAMRTMLEQNIKRLSAVLEDFGVKGEIINVYPGPVVTLYELEPAPGVKSSRITSLSDDIARSMSSISARIAIIPGRNAIGIELPNVTREIVYLRDMLESPYFQKSKEKLVLVLGKTIAGAAVVADLTKMPHVLVAGTTGSGKSVSINAMILSLVYRLTPEECRLIMIDPKMLELSVYDGIPHLLTPVVTDPQQAIIVLKWAVREMKERYRKMAKIGARNIESFNHRVRAKHGDNLSRTVQTGFNQETGEPIFETEELKLAPMYYIVVIIDEMADLMIVAGKDIESVVQRLAQMARAAGIHVIMATQRPSVDIITGTIKANFPTRISFAVASRIDSRTILGDQGAEQLLGQGDMLFMMGGGRIQRIHGAFVEDCEVERVVAHLKKQGTPKYLSAITEEVEKNNVE